MKTLGAADTLTVVTNSRKLSMQVSASASLHERHHNCLARRDRIRQKLKGKRKKQKKDWKPLNLLI